MERSTRSSEKIHIVQNAMTISDVDHIGRNGCALGVLDNMALQVSEMIAAYNRVHPGEMLPKDPEDVVSQFMAGESVMIVTQDCPNDASNVPTVLYHGTLYTNFENGEEQILGMQVVELGTAIAHPDFRGYGLGALGVSRSALAAEARWGDVLGIATIKQSVTAWAFNQGAQMVPISYYEHPYLSFLTCTCDCSEREGSTCGYRRSDQESTQVALDDVLVRDNGPMSIPCTVIATDTEKALRFEMSCQSLHAEMGGEPVLPRSDRITVDTFEEIGAFFEALK